MRLWRRLLRILGYTGLAALALLLLAFIAVQIQQHMFRHRAERLLADFHSIRLHETTWAEAQAIMQRWSSYGKADCLCDASSCGYAIEISDPNWHLYDLLGERWYGYLIHLHYYDLDARLGSRYPRIFVSFVVQDGRVVRSSVSLAVDVPSWARGADGYSYELLAGAKSRSRLIERRQDMKSDGWILGNDEQLDDHPDYKVGRPGGCENCEEALVTFTPFLDQASIRRFTDFNFDCITRFHPCTGIGDLLPAVAPLRLYQEQQVNAEASPCHTDPRAIGRDADIELEVAAITAKKVIYAADGDMPSHTEEVAKVRILNVLKGQSLVHVGGTLEVRPFSETPAVSPSAPTQQMLPDHRYLIRIAEDQLSPPANPIGLDRCGVLEDTPENRSQLQIGFAQDEKLRRPQAVNIAR